MIGRKRKKRHVLSFPIRVLPEMVWSSPWHSLNHTLARLRKDRSSLPISSLALVIHTRLQANGRARLLEVQVEEFDEPINICDTIHKVSPTMICIGQEPQLLWLASCLI